MGKRPRAVVDDGRTDHPNARRKIHNDKSILDDGPPNAVTLPSPPHSVSSNSPIEPPLIERLEQSYTVHRVTVTANAKINNKVSATLSYFMPNQPTIVALSAEDEGSSNPNHGTPNNHAMVALSARAPSANKMVSVVEITKRTLESENVGWYQYSAVWGRLEQLVRTNKEAEAAEKAAESAVKTVKKFGLGRRLGDGAVEALLGSEDQEMHDPADDDEEEAFEPMEVEVSQPVRNIPVLTVYLSRVSIPELKAQYGEQAGFIGRTLS
ncbi:hypothetical protein K402DRAFT_462394 [Aulographum hederae CBS 113979]|uniref:DNA/RNA-binding protein Alba-like domain-containing protein n=1 Tax=Aulographum hederae CBS 113979 TaxID=1176131 RepID=A0A6G1H4P1_9PEZI|nr:hypothetical protein K402DRAFT_462394 [Aulographum hederae CBS 113979]